MNPYTAMAASSILAIGVPVDKFEVRETEAGIQSGLIRLGYDIGNIDGYIGPRSKSALTAAGITATNSMDILSAVESLLHDKFPGEYEMGDNVVHSQPDHIFL